MIHSRLLRPNELGSRIDTPMREASRPAQSSTTNSGLLNGLPTPSSLLSTPHELTPEGQTTKMSYKMPHESPASGFTAVNGDAHRNVSFRPDNSVQRASNTSQPEGRDFASEASAGPHQVHNWRPDERSTVESCESHSPHSNKRRRVEASPSNRARLPTPGEEETLKQSGRAAVAPISTNTSTDPQQSDSHPTSGSTRESKTTIRYEREPSPIFTKDRGAPPPPPRPEVAAGLAESLQRELAATQDSQQQVSPVTQTSQQHVSAAPHDVRPYGTSKGESGSPADEPYDRQQSPPSESENGHAGDDDPSSKKRKRNFSNRTKTGCHTCRSRKKKCDENKPTCHNCQRGSFTCAGYGPKPPGGTKVSAGRPLTAIKPSYEPSHGPSQFSTGPYYDNRARQLQPPYEQPGYGPPLPPRSDPHGLPSVHHYNHTHAPPPAEYRPRDAYSMHYQEPPHFPERFPPQQLPPPPPSTEYGTLAPYRPYPDPNSHPTPQHNHPVPPGPPAPHSLSRYAALDQYHGPPGPPTTISSKDSVISSHASGQRSRPGLVYRSGEKIHRSKMITGEPCSYFTDKSLINERSSCKEVLERYNDADKTTSGVHMDQKGVIFSQLLNPKERGEYGHSWDGPIGTIGDRVVVQAPFSCEYGYNLHFGDENMIMRNCTFQDAATISIGSHVTIGPGCSFLTLISPTSSGPHGLHSAGAIRVEDGCTIGGNVTILPFRSIGKGATVIAGSVVTKDVKPNSTVAGNPAKPVRDDDTEVIEKENAKMLKEMQNDTWRRERYS